MPTENHMISGNLIEMSARTYKAKLIEVPVGGESFKVAGTLDGFIDLATPEGTYQLSLDEAQQVIAALNNVISDVRRNCLYETDALLVDERRP